MKMRSKTYEISSKELAEKLGVKGDVIDVVYMGTEIQIEIKED